MDHLQLSVTDPKPEELLTNFSRAVNYTKDSVEFKVGFIAILVHFLKIFSLFEK